jgi:hypothetical protein
MIHSSGRTLIHLCIHLLSRVSIAHPLDCRTFASVILERVTLFVFPRTSWAENVKHQTQTTATGSANSVACCRTRKGPLEYCCWFGDLIARTRSWHAPLWISSGYRPPPPVRCERARSARSDVCGKSRVKRLVQLLSQTCDE